ncbi:MAG: hypothetical protein JO307_16220 [Bryobacterales bacterium]|nr:hypothetical protein [Bryobacterales bacterium]MBV9397758.1 hypothetical protein [Bryobacterales bacterium]
MKRFATPLVVLCVLAAQCAWAQGRGGGSGKAAAPPAGPAEPTPRSPDGRPNLGSTPDHKGYWELRPGLGGMPRANEVPFQPWARALYQYRTSKADLYPPLVNCKPAAGPSFFNAPGFEIVDVPELKRVYLLNIAGPHSWRVIYMDGRPHPQGEDLRPTFFGHSVGRWEGDTLVVDSVGFNEKQWIAGAYPTTEQLHLTERFTRPNLKTLSYEAIIDDPGAYTKPWSVKWTITETTASKFIPGGEMFEYICQDAGR